MEYENDIAVQPLPKRRRTMTFVLLVILFVGSLPVLFLYATGYRFNLGIGNTLTPTGGLYIAADRTGAEIYIDNELVRETRTFGRAFYAQGLEPGTHRVHVQKLDHHTWVKELPVYAHLVTEAQAFNLPEVPEVRLYSPWRNTQGDVVLAATPTPAVLITNEYVIAPNAPAAALIPDTEHASIERYFNELPTSSPSADIIETSILDQFTASEEVTATTTKVRSGVRLYQSGEEVYATWIGPRSEMPYYYCADAFDLLSEQLIARQQNFQQEILIGPVQYVPEDTPCDPTIRIDRKGEAVRAFDFYPGSTDFVILARDSGIYMIEIDDRAWQNVQSVMEGMNLDMRVENNNLYVYDGILIYQVLF